VADLTTVAEEAATTRHTLTYHDQVRENLRRVVAAPNGSAPADCLDTAWRLIRLKLTCANRLWRP